VILYVKCRFFSVAHGFQLDNGVTSPGWGFMADTTIQVGG
jgi:hypothetical protein